MWNSVEEKTSTFATWFSDSLYILYMHKNQEVLGISPFIFYFDLASVKELEFIKS